MATNYKLPPSSATRDVSITFTKSQSSYLEKWYQSYRHDDQESLNDAIHRFLVATSTQHRAVSVLADIESANIAVWDDQRAQMIADFPEPETTPDP